MTTALRSVSGREPAVESGTLPERAGIKVFCKAGHRYPAARDLTAVLGLKSLNPKDLDKVLLPALIETPEQALSLWSYIKSAVLNNMISQFQAMLIDQGDTASWKSFLKSHTSLVHEALRDRSCGTFDRTPSQEAETASKSDNILIIAAESPDA
ncbi:hypothetical protein HBO01_06085 [Pseudomonas rhodesiae]|uniref:hypothetical protein n=1 Tax=Pseudomonas rhodesiae TaxID=76760 RepID=UPI00147285AE|nr:hypothetical protein [Pseudomonas rhodesiae]NMY78241.1 hypothetical protein [Pseudomonas rhodesiae]